MFTITFILLLAALIVAIVSALGKAPLWISVVLLCIVGLLQVLPVK